jgi:cephalosporin hydroxylase
MTLEEKLNELIQTPSDINEHLATLKNYAARCEHVTEMGVRWIVSTYAFLAGKPQTLVSIDMTHPRVFGADLSTVEQYADGINCNFSFIESNTLNLEIAETDLLFIDTWHAYKQLIAELRLHQAKVKSYIILHDTTSYANHDEGSYAALGDDWQPEGIGLWKAVEDFLSEFPDWQLEHRYTHNNGLTVLKRK